MNKICKNCGGIGHDEVQCPSEPQQSKGHAMWMKFDNVTEEECDELLKGIVDVKRKVAPKARGTFAKAPKHELPAEIKKALMIE